MSGSMAFIPELREFLVVLVFLQGRFLYTSIR